MADRLLLFLAAAASVLACAGAARAQPAQPIYRELRDWILACDNVRTCTAKAVPGDDGASGPQSLTIVRDAGPAGRIIARLSAEDDIDPAAVRLDGKPLTGALRWRREDGTAVVGGASALALVAQVKNGSAMTLGTRKDAPRISLNGMAAVLLAMDEAQGRLGNASALARPGPAPASATPPAPALPTVFAAPAPKPLADKARLIAAVRKGQARLLKAHECDAEGTGDEAAPLTGDEAIVLVQCQLADYQGSALAFRVPRAAPEKARLLILPPQPTMKDDPALAGEYGDPDYDPKTATFSEHAKGRGIGDCGVATSWVFDGRDFHLARFDRQERCGGGAGDWPTIFRTRTTPAR